MSDERERREPDRVVQAAITGGLLILVLAFGAWLRFAGATPQDSVPLMAEGGAPWLRLPASDWDDGQHLHPDERFLTMVGSSLDLPQDLLGYLDTDTSPLNPRNRGHSFFSYGTWPITLTYLLADRLGETAYGSIYLVGRSMSALLDLLSILLVFGIGARLYDRRVGLLAAALSAATAFHVQQAHFFTVDAPLTTFVLLTLFGLAGVLRYGRWLDLALAGVGLGMALGSKVSVWPLVPVAVIAIGLAELRRRDETGALVPLGRALLMGALKVGLLGLVSLVALKLAQPDMFAGPGWPNVVNDPARYQQVTAGEWVAPEWWHTIAFLLPDALEMYLLPDPRWADSMHRIGSQVTGFGMDWPPNHQWFGRVAYLFPAENMVRWGMGWPLGLAAWIAWAAAGIALLRGGRRHLLLWLWVTIFFAFQGIQWAKTMRYFLPIYPALTILASWALVRIWDWARGRRVDAEETGDTRALTARIPSALRSDKLALGLMAVVLLGTAVWGVMFSRIYTVDHSRVAASKWIYHNLPTAFALRVSAEDEELGEEIRGPWLPASPASDLSFERFRWTAPEGGWIGPMRVIVPGAPPISAEDDPDAPPSDEAPRVTVDGARIGFAEMDEGAGGTVRVAVSTDAGLGEDGRPRETIAEGEAAAETGADGPHLVVDLASPTELIAGEEYYLWVRPEGTSLAGRPAVLAYETSWDDIVPIGLLGYGGYDDPNSSWAEGLFGVANFDMYGEDYPTWLDDTLATMEEIDYWVSSSNRVYGAIAQLPMRFPGSLGFYRDALFGEGFGFEHTASIGSYPRLGPVEVPDQAAEEAFHVYDHPRVDVFRRTEDYDPEGLRAHMETLHESRTWTGFPPEADSRVTRFLDALLGRIPVGREPSAAAAQEVEFDDPDDRPEIDLPPERWAAQQAGMTWSSLFSADGLTARYPWLAAGLWYLALGLLGLLALPLVALALPNLADRGYAAARAVGLLGVSWAAWAIASTGLVPHRSALVWACALGLGALSGLAVWRGAFDPRAFWREHRQSILRAEAVALVLFLFFLLVRAGNPDLWHPYFGGEKPMDLAYLNAVLRSRSFPPLDPWFAGGRMNYYYFGFVVVASLVEMTRVVPWVAYNLAVPTMAMLTGLLAFGAVDGWLRGAGRARAAAPAGVLAAVLAVISGNLFQVPWLLGRFAEVSGSTFQSALPGLERLVRAGAGALEVARGQASLSLPTHHWYWNASRAIPSVTGDVQPITEFPMFTFLYGDLHAHMMAMPVVMLVLVVSLSWALPKVGGAGAWLGRLLLGALAVGALWPTNTWDYPSWGLVAAGAIMIGAWRRTFPAGQDAWAVHGGTRWGGPLAWALRVAATGLPLLALSLLLYLPYHLWYVTPYSDFAAWEGYRTQAKDYLVVHGLFLFAAASWALWRLARALQDQAERRRATALLIGGGVAAAVLAAAAWYWAIEHTPPELFLQNDPLGVDVAPSPWTPAIIAALLLLGVAVLCLRRASDAERLGAWLLIVGAFLTGLVEYVVLSGDIGRMNTVFKFYIQVWLMWAVLAAFSAGVLADALEGGARRAWLAAFGLLLAGGLVYTVTAVEAKHDDRFPAMGPMSGEEREAFEAAKTPGLDGAAFLDTAVYDDDGFPLTLAHDRDAFLWLLENVEGTPTLMEGYRVKGYRWGARYSIWTGLPAVIGWDWHQTQQRNAGRPWEINERTADVAQLYNTTDDAVAREILDRYDVDILVLGEMERAFYDPEGLAKLDRWADEGRLERLYENEGVTLFGVPDEGAAQEDPADDGEASAEPESRAPTRARRIQAAAP